MITDFFHKTFIINLINKLMKRLKYLATIAMMVASLNASAQFANVGKSSVSSASTEGWNTIWAEWNPSSFLNDAKDADNQSFTGLSLGYSRAFSVMSSHPLFVEAGLGLQYSFYKESLYEGYDDGDEIFNMFSLKLPVNLIYKFEIPNSSVSIMPFLGLALRFNLSANSKSEYNDGYYASTEKFNLFDKDDMGSSKETWNRFQIGWQIGTKVGIGKNFILGLSYGTDFSEIADDIKVGAGTISLGYAF